MTSRFVIPQDREREICEICETRENLRLFRVFRLFRLFRALCFPLFVSVYILAIFFQFVDFVFEIR
jgi:hypothetical protein